MDERWYLGGERLTGRNLSFPMRCVFERSFTALLSCFSFAGARALAGCLSGRLVLVALSFDMVH